MTSYYIPTETEHARLRRCVDLAIEALADGDSPFGSVLTDAEGTVLFEDRNRIGGGDNTRHPEFAIARWAAENLTPEERRTAVVYTSGEHCPMCSAAHAANGLGRIVYATATTQLVAWREEWGIPAGPVAPLPITAIAPGIDVAGPVEAFADEIKELQRRRNVG
ncbi:MAG: nucleoside deaminase [Microbacterium sp.]